MGDPRVSDPVMTGLGDAGRRHDQVVTLVAAVARNGVIGADGGMPWHLPDDLAHFKAITMGHPMVMGRKTFEAIGRPLPGRRTIVVTHDSNWHMPGVTRAGCLAEAVAAAGPGEVMVVGGGRVYAQAMPLADRLELTQVHAEHQGDTYFPEVSANEWDEIARHSFEKFDFVTYRRRGDHKPDCGDRPDGT